MIAANVEALVWNRLETVAAGSCRGKKRTIMHSCPECGMACRCDMEDHDQDAPEDCCHECEELPEEEAEMGMAEFFDEGRGTTPSTSRCGERALGDVEPRTSSHNQSGNSTSQIRS